MAKRPLIFNLTRLLGRMYSSAPTGVDRLDVRYARHFLDGAEIRHVFFVHQSKNSLSLIPLSSARLLIDSLWKRWMRPASEQMYGRLYKERAMHLRAYFKTKLLRYVSNGIDPALVGALRHLSPPVFVNAGHTGVQHTAIHEKLREALKADLVYYLHDLIPIDYPEYVRTTSFSDIHAVRVNSMARTGSLVIANSHYTRDRFVSFCKEKSICPPPCEVLEIGVQDVFQDEYRQKKSRLPRWVVERTNGKPYFVSVGTIEPRKNHLMLLQVWRQLAMNWGGDCPVLVLIGRRGWENENVLDMLERCPSARKNVVELNGIPDSEMIPIVRHAAAALYPSFEEGWGIPVTEALTLGTTVICSDIPAHRECSQGKAIFLDPLDGIGWMRTIRSISDGVDNSAAADTYTTKAGFEPMTWDKHMNRLEDLLDSLVPGPKSAAVNPQFEN